MDLGWVPCSKKLALSHWGTFWEKYRSQELKYIFPGSDRILGKEMEKLIKGFDVGINYPRWARGFPRGSKWGKKGALQYSPRRKIREFKTERKTNLSKFPPFLLLLGKTLSIKPPRPENDPRASWTPQKYENRKPPFGFPPEDGARNLMGKKGFFPG